MFRSAVLLSIKQLEGTDNFKCRWLIGLNVQKMWFRCNKLVYKVSPLAFMTKNKKKCMLNKSFSTDFLHVASANQRTDRRRGSRRTTPRNDSHWPIDHEVVLDAQRRGTIINKPAAWCRRKMSVKTGGRTRRFPPRKSNYRERTIIRWRTEVNVV